MKKKILIIIIVLLIILSLVTAVTIFAIKKNNNTNIIKPAPIEDEIIKNASTYSLNYQTNSYVSQSIEYLDEVKRSIPVMSSNGLGYYPTYNTNNQYTQEQKEAIALENDYLIASSTTYDSMDSNGNLYKDDKKINKKLYKHEASVGMYGFDVLDEEKAYSALVKIKPRTLGNYLTGLYAPAGEIIKIEVDQKYLDETGGFDIIIGQVSQRGHIIEIPLNRDFTRMPIITNKMRITSTVAYVGNYFGRPIYIGEPNNKKYFEVKISGGVKYPYYLHGETTKERFEENKKSSAQFFDLEVFNDAVRHSGPFFTINDFTYDDCYNSAILWEKMSTISNQIPSGSHGGCGISFIYDTHVVAGGAVAFVGANYVNAPISWFRGALYYDDFIMYGSWGAVHEYNHHYQNFGIIRGNETTNNVVNLLSYAMYTDISSNRSLNDKNLSGWNEYTDASRVLRILLNESNKNSAPISSLASYATLIHSFGVDTFLKAASSGAHGADDWYLKLCETTNYDMTYYFENILHQTISNENKEFVKTLQLPMYVPSAIIYQTGQKYENYEFETMRPYHVDIKELFELDLNERIILPEGVGFVVKKINAIDNCSYKNNGDNKYLLSFNDKLSKLEITIGLTGLDYKLNDITFILQFKDKYKMFEVAQYSSADIPSDLNVDHLTPVQVKYEHKLQFVGTNNTVYKINGKIDCLKEGVYEFKIKDALNANITFNHNNKDYVLNNNNTVLISIKNYDVINVSGYVNTENLKASQLLFRNNNGSYKIVDTRLMSTNVDLLSNPYERTYKNENVEIYNDSYVSSVNYTPWNNDYLIENMFDGVNNKYMHSKYIINDENPFELIVKLDKEQYINYLKFYGFYMDGNEHIPTIFDLFISLDNFTYTKVGSFENFEIKNKELAVNFDKTKALYVKLIVKQTSSKKYVALNDLEIGYQTGYINSPDYSKYLGPVEYKNSVNAHFGHLISAKYLEQDVDGEIFALYGNSKSLKLKITLNGNTQVIRVEDKSDEQLFSIKINQKCKVIVEVLEGELEINYLVY